MKGQFDDLSAWRGAVAPSLAEIEALAADAYARLPEHFRGLCEKLVIQVADFPTEEVLDQMKVETEFDLLGLFQGVGLPFQSTSVLEPLPNMVWLYRRPILDYWGEHEDSLGAIVTHVLVHDIGHHFGLSDAAMEAIEPSADEKETTVRIAGPCHCGYLSFEAEADPVQVSICHCTDCPNGSGTAFRTSIRAPGKTFKMLSGEPTLFLKTTADSGNHRLQAFCPTCGTP